MKKRSVPGVLIFGEGSRLQYANKEALDMIPALRDGTGDSEDEAPHVPAEIAEICTRLNDGSAAIDPVRGNTVHCELLDRSTGVPLSLRAFFISGRERNGGMRHIMVLVERVVEKHAADFEKAQRDYNLSKREAEVLRHICGGLTNRAIAERMFISEYTVKDHIKKIMKNMGAASRSEIIALLT